MLINILGFIILASFYITYIVKMLFLKKQGITGNLLGKGDKKPKALIIEELLKYATGIGAVVQFINVMFSSYLCTLAVPVLIRYIGVLLSVTGFVFFLMSVLTMRNNWRAGFDSQQQTNLVTSGIYAVSRNPAFLGFDLLYIGCTLAFPNLLMVIVTLIAVALFHYQILGEEEYLQSTFGEAYMSYRKKVKKYF